MTTIKTPLSEARTILEDWASDLGVKIEWFHDWDVNGRQYVTATGLDARGHCQHHTVSWPIEAD